MLNIMCNYNLNLLSQLCVQFHVTNKYLVGSIDLCRGSAPLTLGSRIFRRRTVRRKKWKEKTYPATAAADAAHFSNSRRRCLRVIYIRGAEWPIFIITFWVVTVTVARPNLVYA